MSPGRIIEQATFEPFRPARREAVSCSPEERLEEEFRRGYAEGLVAGRAESEERIEQERQRFARSVSAALERIAELERRAGEALQADLLALAVEIAGRVVHARIEAGDPVAERVARDLLEGFHVDVGARVHVNPEDRRRIIAGDGDHAPRGVELVDDAGLGPGEVVIEWRDEQIDARLEAVLEQIVGELRGGS